jgi:hypothetical protein
MHKDQVLIKKTNKIDIHGYILSGKLVPPILKTDFFGVTNTLCSVRKKNSFQYLVSSNLNKQIKKLASKLGPRVDLWFELDSQLKLASKLVLGGGEMGWSFIWRTPHSLGITLHTMPLYKCVKYKGKRYTS